MTMTTMAAINAVKGKEPSFLLTSGATSRISALFSVRALRTLAVLLNTLFFILLRPFLRRPVLVVDNNIINNKDVKDDHHHHHSSSSHHHHRKGALLCVPPTIVPWKISAISRRAMAIRRVLEEDVVDASSTSCLRDYFLFRTPRGDTIFTQSWIPLSSVDIRGIVFLMHGLNEHSGRYGQFAKRLNANGYKVYGMDWVGHGGSDGLHAYVHSIEDAVSDMKIFVEKVVTDNPGLPCFCFGHSTGAAITLKALLDPKTEGRIAGAVLTSPAVGVVPSHPILLVLAPIVSFLLPTYQCSSAYKKGLPVSRDPEAVIAKYSDPLVCTGALRVRTGYEILRITGYLQQNLRKIRVPFFILHGTADSVTDPGASQKLYDEASSSDKSIKLYEGFSHDLLFEPERDDITRDIIQWLNHRV